MISPTEMIVSIAVRAPKVSTRARLAGQCSTPGRGLSAKDTLRSWTVMTTLVSLIGFAGIFAIGLVIG